MSACKVALDCRLLGWPGLGRYCREVSSALVDAAPDIHFYWLCGPGDSSGLPSGPMASKLVLRSGPMSLREQVEVPRVLARHGIRLLHAPAAQTFPMFVPRLVVTVHDLTLRHFPQFLPNPLGRLYYWLMTTFAAHRADRLVAISQFTARDVATEWPRSQARISVVRNGVAASFAPVTSEVERSRVRVQMALPPHYLLYIGTWKQHKNLPLLLRAYGRLSPSQRQRFPLVLVAPSDDRYPEVPAAARAAGIEADVLWRSDVPEAALPALYSMARCLILPSLYEGFGAPVVEAMACGTPCVVSTGGALPEVGGDACLSFEPSDEAACAACLARLIDDDALHADLSARARRRAPEFDRTEVARSLAAIYRELLE